MEKDRCFYLGKITKSVGFKGELVAFIDADEPDYYKNIDSVFLDMRGKLIPYFIDYTGQRNKNNQLTIKFTDIDNQEMADMLQGCALYLPIELLPPLSGNKFYFHEVEGYAISDKNKGDIGIITRILDYPGNPLFEINYKDKQILIPVNDRFMREVDRQNKIIHIDAPEGLIDIYLNEESE